MITARTNAAPGTAPGPGGCGGAAAGRGSPRSAGSGPVPVAGGWGSRVCVVCIQQGHPHGVLQLLFILDSHKKTCPGSLCFPLVKNQTDSSQTQRFSRWFCPNSSPETPRAVA